MVDNLPFETVIYVITNGILLLGEDRRSLRFKLCNKKCSVSGLLIQRPDWSDKFGRPGLMPLIEEIEYPAPGGWKTMAFDVEEKLSINAYDTLAKRLNPNKLYVRAEQGWVLGSAHPTPRLAQVKSSLVN